MLFSMMLFVSCSDSANDPNPPAITPPSDNSVLVNESTDLTFNVSTDGGYGSATVTATNGEATITAEPESGAPNGEVIVSFTGTSDGAGAVELTVTDQDGLSTTATAVIAVGEEQKVIQVNGNISSDQTWEDGKTYILSGRIAVEAGVTLTIEGGAIVKGEAGQEANSSVLLVARDATLNANGTADQPVIFTSVADEITPDMVDAGTFASPNLTASQRGLWGGVIVLGNAPVSASNESGDVTEVQIEGIPSSDQNGLYGGDDPNDSSGSLTYVSIRHGGTLIGEGNEINGLTLGGVGSGTTVENVEVVANQDDGVEFFGGTVNASNILVWNNGDDAIDTDQAWAGTLDNVVVVNPGESGFELDGPEGTYTGGGHTITNGTVYMGGTSGTSEELFDVDEDTDVNLNNILFFGLRTSNGEVANVVSSDYPEYANNTDGYAVTNLQAVIPAGFALSDFFTGGSAQAATEVTDLASATVGADASVFAFTWANTSGALSDIGL